MLYIVSTPIGNLSDITLRALDVLRECDYILCEDTRRSRILLDHYEIKKPLVAFHKFSEKKEEERILRDLEEGKKIALVSDAGTPLIADPGQALVERLAQKNLPFTALPGPCSLIQALVLSGFETGSFQFTGFLPKKESEEKEALRKMLFFPGVSVAFCSPSHLLETLGRLRELDPKCRVAVARELTKVYEEGRRGTPEELIAHFEKEPPRGEIVLLVEKGSLKEEEVPLEEFIALLQNSFGLSLKDAIKLAAKLLKEPKSKIYKKMHTNLS